MDTKEVGSPAMSDADIENGDGIETGDGRGIEFQKGASFSSSNSSPPYILRMVLNVAGLCTLGVMSFYAFKKFTPERGFYCNDPEIGLPKKPETVAFAYVIYSAVVAPFFFICLLEFLLWRVRATNEDKKEGGLITASRVDVYRHIGGFLTGVFACWGMTDILKSAAGSLRPFFLEACKPDWSKITCKDANGIFIYVPEAHCTARKAKLRGIRRSFPSGHSSFAMCGMLYTIMYLQSRFKWHKNHTTPKAHPQKGPARAITEKLYWVVEALTPLMQTLLFMFALYVPTTRVVDHFHHIRDVVTGCLVGAIAALFGSFFVADLKRR